MVSRKGFGTLRRSDRRSADMKQERNLRPAGAARAQDVAVECRHVWKVFGAHADAGVGEIRSGTSTKAELFERTGCTAAVIDVSFSVQRGETFCIMGLSGSGKSTLVRHINRLVEPTDGEIFVDGIDIGKVSNTDLRRLRAGKIGMVFQHMALFPHHPVWRNVAYGLEVQGLDKTRRKEIARQKLSLVHLADCENRFPHELSGGMQQRVGLARALAADPDILLMDEAFSALDPLIRRQLQDQFIDLARDLKKTTIFITHDLEEAMRLGDRIAIMREGRFVQVGTPEEIVLSPADDYVREFIRGVPRMKVLRARSIMEPLSSNSEVEALSGLPRASLDTELEALMALAAVGTTSVVITDGRDRPLGVVTLGALLQAVRGPEQGGLGQEMPSGSMVGTAAVRRTGNP